MLAARLRPGIRPHDKPIAPGRHGEGRTAAALHHLPHLDHVRHDGGVGPSEGERLAVEFDGDVVKCVG